MTDSHQKSDFKIPEGKIIYSVSTPKPDIHIGEYILKYPNNIAVTYENGYQCLDIESLDIHGVGKDFEEAVRDLENEIGFAYSHYALGDQKRLSRDARDYGNMLKKNIELRQ